METIIICFISWLLLKMNLFYRKEEVKMYFNTPRMWLISQYLLNEPKEKRAVPHNALQRTLFPNQGLFSPTLPDSSSTPGKGNSLWKGPVAACAGCWRNSSKASVAGEEWMRGVTVMRLGVQSQQLCQSCVLELVLVWGKQEECTFQRQRRSWCVGYCLGLAGWSTDSQSL